MKPNHDDVIKWKHFPRCWPLCGEFTGQRSQRPGDLKSICWRSRLDTTDMKSLIVWWHYTWWHFAKCVPTWNEHVYLFSRVHGVEIQSYQMTSRPSETYLRKQKLPLVKITNGLSSVRRQAIIWINVSLFLFSEPLGTSRNNTQN